MPRLAADTIQRRAERLANAAELSAEHHLAAVRLDAAIRRALADGVPAKDLLPLSPVSSKDTFRKRYSR